MSEAAERPSRALVLRRRLVAAAIVAALAAGAIVLAFGGGEEGPGAGTGESTAGGDGGGDAKLDSRPNFVVIMTDDQTLAQMSAMPRTNRLIGDAGATFERFYATDPLCCPSRATFLTGQYAHNTGVVSNGGPKALEALDESATLPVWLQDAGYQTIHIGKYLNGYGIETDRERIPPGYDDWRALLEPTQNYFSYELNENGEERRYGVEPEDYKTTLLGDKAVTSIHRAAKGPRPFFAFVGFNAPHAPSRPEPGDIGAFAGLAPSDSPAFNEADVSDKPGFIADQPPLDETALAEVDPRRQAALESLIAVDREVAEIIAGLEREGELEDTYVVFTSDNGYFEGEHRIPFGKLLPYEPASHVPLLIRGPGVQQGATVERLVGNIDLAPTIAALAGAEPTLELDGRPLLPLERGEAPGEPDRPLLLEALIRDRSTFYGFPYEAIRTDRYLYVSYATGDEELYDFERDPDQLESRHDDPAYTEVRNYLAAALEPLAGCFGAACDQPLGRPPAPR